MRTTKLALMALVCGVALVALPAASRAEGEATFGGQWWNQSQPEAKYREFRDLPRGPFLESFWLSEWKDKNQFWANGTNPVRRDQHEKLGWARGPRARIDLSYGEIPHLYSQVATTPWTEVTPGVFLLPDSLQAFNQASAKAKYNATMTDLMNTANGAALAFRTDIATARLRARPVRAWQFEVTGTARKRSGSKALGTAFGFSNEVELWAPINHRMIDADGKARFNRDRVSVEASGGVSLFDNRVDRVLFDNPQRLTDTYVAGGRGQVGLPPDNREIHGNVALGLSLPHRTAFAATVGLAQRGQDQDWLPVTVNTVLAASDTARLPGTNTDAKATVLTQDYRLTTHALSRLSATVRFQHYKYDNKTPEWTFLRISPLDQSWNSASVTSSPLGNSHWTMGGELEYPVIEKVTVGALAEYRNRERTDREVDQDHEFVVGGKARLRPAEGLSVNAHYRYGNREPKAFSEEEMRDQGEQLGLRRFDISKRKQQDAGGNIAWTPNEKLDLSADYAYLQNKHEDVTYGLRKEQDHTVYAQATVHAHERLDVNGGFGLIQMKSDEISREFNPTSTPPLSNLWAANITDQNTYALAGFEWTAMPDKVVLSASYELSRDESTFDLNDSLKVALDLPTTKYFRHDVMVETRYQALVNAEVVARYGWEQWDVEDFAAKGLSQLGFTPGSPPTLAAIYLGSFYRDYRAHRIALLVRYNF
jgi:MtrB/PioB family decaheme-associated outer membrane protein